MKSLFLSSLFSVFFSIYGYSQFTPNSIGNPGDMVLQNAACDDCQNLIRLTSAQGSGPLSGSAYWSNQAVDFTQDFITTFDIRFSNIGAADGITVTIQNLGPNFIGGGGGDLGIYDGIPTHQAIVAEFDIYRNGGTYGDPAADHFAITGSTDEADIIVNPIPITLTNNCWESVIVTWSCNELRYFLNGQLLATLTVQDVLNAFNQTLPTNAIFGFTAGIASQSNDQDVCFQSFLEFPKPMDSCEQNLLVDCGDSFDLNSLSVCCGQGTQSDWVDHNGIPVPNGIINNITEPGIYSRQTVNDCSICRQIVNITVSSPTLEILLTPADADFFLSNPPGCCLGISINTLIDKINDIGVTQCNFTASDFPDDFETWPITPPTNDLLLMCSGNSYYVEAGCCIIEFNIICNIPLNTNNNTNSSFQGHTIEKLDFSDNKYEKNYERRSSSFSNNNDQLIRSKAFDIVLQPNPTDGKVKAVISDETLDEIEFIEIFNKVGNRISTLKGTETQEELDLSNLPTGMYFLRFTSVNKETVTKKVILNR